VTARANRTSADPRELLRLATAGSVDDGKSTLLGRLLLDTKLLLSDQLAAVSQGRDGTPDLAALTDGLRAEREQGITIDVAYRYFATPRRTFILADTPGHERYTRNMFTGASTAELALVLIDARAGVVTQTRRHAQITALLRIPHVVVAVNKMDLVDFSQARFDEVAAQARTLGENLGLPELEIVPISALDGDNVVDPSDRAPWYAGPPLLEILETVDVAAHRDTDESHLRLPIQWVARPPDGARVYTGQLAAGTLKVGDEVVVVPSGATTTVTSVETLDPDRQAAVPPMSVGVTVADDIDIGRGDLLAAPDNRPPAARELDTTICWMAEQPLAPGRRYALKHTTRTVRATVQAIDDRWDPETLEIFSDPSSLELNDIGRVRLRTSSPVLADPYRRNAVTGAFILIDEHSNDTVGAGIIREARELEATIEKRRDVTWHPSALDRGNRWRSLRQTGATVWLTGLPASGKSTIAVALERQLVSSGQAAYLLDGDNIRHGLSDDLGFAPGDRAENVRRVGQVARLFADAGVIALVSLVSPLRSDREVPRQLHLAAELPFIEVHVDTSVQECARRDPKGLYARARAGEIKGFTGVDAPYEAPQDPEIHLDTAETDITAAVARILAALDLRHDA
jgi:bifunctional enzyme CysN/CysC